MVTQSKEQFMEKEIVVKFPENQFYCLAGLLQLLVVAGLELNGTGNAIPTKEELKEIWRTIIQTKLK